VKRGVSPTVHPWRESPLMHESTGFRLIFPRSAAPTVPISWINGYNDPRFGPFETRVPRRNLSANSQSAAADLVRTPTILISAVGLTYGLVFQEHVLGAVVPREA
jgi:hypothetical protein